MKKEPSRRKPDQQSTGETASNFEMINRVRRQLIEGSTTHNYYSADLRSTNPNLARDTELRVRDQKHLAKSNPNGRPMQGYKPRESTWLRKLERIYESRPSVTPTPVSQLRLDGATVAPDEAQQLKQTIKFTPS